MTAAPLDVDELTSRLAPLGATNVAPLAGGASSLTYSAHVEGRRVVVKVAPPGLAPVLNRDVLRQARLLRALHDTTVAVPEILWEDPGEPPEIPPLFVMSFADGASLEPLFDRDGQDPDPVVSEAVMAERMRDAARTLAALHAVVPGAVGLGDEPAAAIVEEIDRWCRLLETVDPGLAPGWEDVSAALRGREPAPVRAAIVHGDFRLGNLLAEGPSVTAIIDWEIWSVTDPRVDLGWFVANADPATYERPTQYAGRLPSPTELVAIYASAFGQPVADVAWFQALACFKATATWSLIVKHNRRRAEPDPEVEAMPEVLPHLLERARQLMA